MLIAAAQGGVYLNVIHPLTVCETLLAPGGWGTAGRTFYKSALRPPGVWSAISALQSVGNTVICTCTADRFPSPRGRAAIA
jgi:hypothetical protein